MARWGWHRSCVEHDFAEFGYGHQAFDALFGGSETDGPIKDPRGWRDLIIRSEAMLPDPRMAILGVI